MAGSLLLWAMPIALLPPDAAGATLIGATALALWLCRPERERLAVRLFGHAVPISRGEEMLLRPTLARLEEARIKPGPLYIAPNRRRQVLAEPFGRCSTVLAQRLLTAVAQGRVDPETMAVILAHAEGRRAARFGMQHDIARRVVLVPGRAATSLVRGLIRRLRWIPAARAFPAIAAVVIAAAIWQTFARGQWRIGLLVTLTTAGIAISVYARDHWTRHVDSAADRFVARQGLSVSLGRLLISEATRRSLDRAEAIGADQDPPASPMRHLYVVSDPCT